MLNELCYYAKPVLFIERSYIRKEGDPIDEMLFIVQGKLRTYSSCSKDSESDNTAYLGDGDFCGEELLEECLHIQYHQSLHLPISNKNIQALTRVEAFSLLAEDLKSVYDWAARQLQLAYRHHKQIKVAGGRDKISASGNISICASTPDNSALGAQQLINVHFSDRSPRPVAVQLAIQS